MKTYDVLAVAAHPDDIEVAMGGTVAKLRKQGHRVLIVDLTGGEPARHAERGTRAKQAETAARILNVDRICLGLQDRFLVDDITNRLQLATLIRKYRPRLLFSTIGCQVHPDHLAVAGIVEGATFYARLPKWDEIKGGDELAQLAPHDIDRLYNYHCRMEPYWEHFDFAVDVSDVYELKRQAVAAYESVFSGEQAVLISRFQAEDQYIGSLVNVAYAETFRARGPLVVDDITVFRPVRYG